MSEETKRVIEINGVKMEVDMRYAKRVDELRIGSRVKVLIKEYSSYKIYLGVSIIPSKFATKVLRFTSSKNQELFGFGVWNSPPMDSPPNGGQYNWSAEGRFPPEFFDQVFTASSLGNC
jgi:hypothetical protein